MNDKERLQQWMRENNHDVKSLAAATGDSVSSIYMLLSEDRQLNQAFYWRFGMAFGFDLAKQIFVVQQATSAPALTPASQ